MEKKLTEGSILKNITGFSLPYLLAYLLQTLYGLADLYIIGQFNGDDTITAVTVGSQVMHMVTVIIVGLAMGATVMISQSVGAGHKKDTSKYIGNTISIFAILTVIMTAVFLIANNGIVRVMSTPSEAVKETRQYLMICFAGIPFILTYNVISSIFRGLGDSKSPMIFVGVACAINVALDYIFIGVLGLQAVGAALGTVISQTCSVIFSIIAILRKRLINLAKDDLRIQKSYAVNILKVGVPVALQDGLIQISFLIITKIANTRGLEIAAAVGVVEKIIGIVFLVPSTMLSTVSAIAAQNNGAGYHDRAKKTLWYGIGICAVFGAVCSVVCQFTSVELVGLFSKKASDAVKLFGSQYLRTYVVDCIFAGIHFCFSGFFCAYNFSVGSFVHNMISVVAIRIPGAYLASKWYPEHLGPMGLAAPVGSLLSDIICIGIFIWINNKKIKGLKNEQSVNSI